jgi:hypothetical protein
MSAIVIRPDLRARKACDDASLQVWLLQNDFLLEIFHHRNDPAKVERLVEEALDLVDRIQDTLALKTSAVMPNTEPRENTAGLPGPNVPPLRAKTIALQRALQGIALQRLVDRIKNGDTRDIAIPAPDGAAP